MKLADEAFVYWTAARGMRCGTALDRSTAAFTLIQLGQRDEDGPVTERARGRINEASLVLGEFDAA